MIVVGPLIFSETDCKSKFQGFIWGEIGRKFELKQENVARRERLATPERNWSALRNGWIL